ncbi:hypothetical protein [Nocardia vinacea]|uniref:hypothetical protein n=1 Tax=Nocardia vinacea TaxID=96468 RepID=UPI000314AE3D|nr:hypothetical protein [Nocardia vinacea]
MTATSTRWSNADPASVTLHLGAVLTTLIPTSWAKMFMVVCLSLLLTVLLRNDRLPNSGLADGI